MIYTTLASMFLRVLAKFVANDLRKVEAIATLFLIMFLYEAWKKSRRALTSTIPVTATK